MVNASTGYEQKPDGQSDSFIQIYQREYLDILRFVERRLNPPDAAKAEDIVQDTFLTAWRRFSEMPTNAAEARAWLFTVARNRLLNEYQTQRRKAALQIRIAAEAQISVPGPEVGATQQLDLAAAWQTLSPTDQEVIALTVWDNLTSAQAAKVLGTSPAAYRIRLHRARNALRKAFEPQLNQLPARQISTSLPALSI